MMIAFFLASCYLLYIFYYSFVRNDGKYSLCLRGIPGEYSVLCVYRDRRIRMFANKRSVSKTMFSNIDRVTLYLQMFAIGCLQDDWWDLPSCVL